MASIRNHIMRHISRPGLEDIELTFPGMKQQRLESTYFINVILSRERRVSTAAKMSA